MKIILWGINYAPESVGIAPFNRELCEHLAAGGHQVSAVSTFPYYPRWRKTPADRGRWRRVEMIGPVTVHRCWCYVPTVVTTLGRILHELSFGLTSLLRVLVLPRADVYVVVSPPLVLGLFAWVATTIKRSRFVFHVQDLQPDAAVGLGMLQRGWLVRLLFGLERLAYAKAAMVSGISGGMMMAFAGKGVPPTKRALMPNWLRLSRRTPPSASDRMAARRRFDIPTGAILAVYSGNLGRKQSLEILIEAAVLLHGRPTRTVRPICLIIAGDGVARPGLERYLHAHQGTGVQLLPLLSDDDYAALLCAADVALITQVTGTGQFFFPSKLLSVLAAGLPVVAVADQDSELARAVHDGDFGCVVQPGDAEGLAGVLLKLAESPATLAAWARRTEWVNQFSRENILPRFEQMLLDVAQGSRRAATKEFDPVNPVLDPVRDNAMPR